MIRSIIKGLRGLTGSEVGREIGLAIIAGAVSWYVAEKLSEYKNKNG
ncbi:MAG: hypothetical protein QM500_21425 [Methylococcales bacterium]